MNRRAFLGAVTRTGSAILVIPVMTTLGAVTMSGCTDSENMSGGSGDTTTFTVDPGGVGSHTHTFQVLNADLLMPPVAGISATTSSDGGHFHTINLTQAQLIDIAASMAVNTNTSFDLNHLHAFVFP
jgi:hypothetical protein